MKGERRPESYIEHPDMVFSFSAKFGTTGNVVVKSSLTDEERTDALSEHQWMKNVWHEAAVISSRAGNSLAWEIPKRMSGRPHQNRRAAVLTRFLPLPIPVPWPADTLSLVSKGLEGLKAGLQETNNSEAKRVGNRYRVSSHACFQRLRLSGSGLKLPDRRRAARYT
jgi:hypothetical protein